MSDYQKYNDIFNKEIFQKSKAIIFSFSPLNDKYVYCPYSHAVSEDAVEQLGALMRRNLFFYSFGETEVIEYYESGCFDTMERAARYAYKNRLPKRADITDGLPSETLLDLLVQLYNPNAYKLAVRTIFRQDDNNEIKGYDLTYFTKDESGISLWLGQAKLGEIAYCKSGINRDLLEKFEATYLSKQLFFVCTKRVALSNDAKDILKTIEKINICTMDKDDSTRAEKLIAYLQDQKIAVKIPCLLAYGKAEPYQNASKLYEQIEAEIQGIRNYFNKHVYFFKGFSPEIVFYVFPIESIERLRNKETGFYAGLC